MANGMVGLLFTFVGLIIQMILQLFAGGFFYGRVARRIF